MTIKPSGTLSFTEIVAEFGGNAPHSLSEYYAAAAGIPASGTIRFSDFYGKSNRNGVSYTFTASTLNANLNVSTIANYVPGSSDITVYVDPGVYLWSDNVGLPGLTLTGGTAGDTLTLINSGFIMGRGGDGDTSGGPGMKISFPTTINNGAGYIGGGGGGGASNGYAARAGAGGAGGGNASTYGNGGSAGGGIGQPGGPCSSSAEAGGGGRIMPGARTYSADPNVGGQAGGPGADAGGYAGGYGGGGGEPGLNGNGNAGNSGGGGGWGAAGGSNGQGGIMGYGGPAIVSQGNPVSWQSGNDRSFGAIS